MKRGEIWWAELFPRSGAALRDEWPVIVISNDGFNSVPTWRSVIILPLSTSKRQLLRGPTAVFIQGKEGGLEEDSIALCHQVTTIDRAKLTRPMGVLSQHVMEEVEAGLKAALDLK
jgi:mRNA interferase MazF